MAVSFNGKNLGHATRGGVLLRLCLRVVWRELAHVRRYMEAELAAWHGVYLAAFKEVGALVVELGCHAAKCFDVGLLAQHAVEVADVVVVI